jgi:hypothetical protein
MWRLVLTTIVNLKAGSTSYRFCYRAAAAWDRSASVLTQATDVNLPAM